MTYTQHNAINCYKERWTCAQMLSVRMYVMANYLSAVCLCVAVLSTIWKHILISISYLPSTFYSVRNDVEESSIKFSPHTRKRFESNNTKNIPLTVQRASSSRYDGKIGSNSELKRQPKERTRMTVWDEERKKNLLIRKKYLLAIMKTKFFPPWGCCLMQDTDVNGVCVCVPCRLKAHCRHQNRE